MNMYMQVRCNLDATQKQLICNSNATQMQLGCNSDAIQINRSGASLNARLSDQKLDEKISKCHAIKIEF